MSSRRDLLAGLLVLGGGYAVLRAGVILYGRRADADPTFPSMTWPPGFRRLVAGSTSAGGFDPFVGIEPETLAAGPVDGAEVGAGPCRALFGELPARDVVPIASFSDYNCPYCRVLTERLAALVAAENDVRVRWHELPILGDGSQAAARAALAARRQGAYAAFHAHLMRAPFQPTEGYLRVLAAELGIDADRLIADMQSDAVGNEIANSMALARRLGTVGTPVVVIGRTVVEGVLSDTTLARLIEDERRAGPLPGCAEG